MLAKYISSKCHLCKSNKVTLDNHYGLPPCHDFILVCPKHPNLVTFDVSIGDMMDIANQEDDLQFEPIGLINAMANNNNSKIDYTVVNATLEAIAPLVRANGQSKEDVTQFIYYLLIIASAMAEEMNVDVEHFKALAVSAYKASNPNLPKVLVN